MPATGFWRVTHQNQPTVLQGGFVGCMRKNDFPIPTLEGIGHRVFFQGLAAMRWSESDNYFVNGSLKVYSVVDLSSEPLKMVPAENVIYDGPEGDDFKNLLLDNGFGVNCHGRAIVRIRKRNSDDEYNVFLVENVVRLSTYGFRKVVSSSPPPPLSSPPQEVKVLKSLLDEINQEVKELRSLLEETRADLAKKNAEVYELHRNWNSGQLRRTMDDIRASMKKVFSVDVDVDDLKPPPPPAAAAIVSGVDPLISVVVGFLEKLRSMLLDKEFGDTSIGAANQIVFSIVSIFNQHDGLSINGLKTSSRTTSAADLIQNLIILREFVESRFFMEGSFIVKDYGLGNEKDIPVIFGDSAAGVAELHRPQIGPKSIDNIDGESLLYGYFNIPFVGKFTGVLTRINFTLPDEILVKLSHRPNYNHNQLDDKSFWFVKANGETIFEKALSLVHSPVSKSSAGNPENVIFDSNRLLVTGNIGGAVANRDNFLGFLRRMNKIFVNKEGKYLKFDFTSTKFSEPLQFTDNLVHYYNARWKSANLFSRVQFDANENPMPFSSGTRVSLPQEFSSACELFVASSDLGEDCAFVFSSFCFIGKITEVDGPSFRRNALVTVFFEQAKLENDCYVDALATTFFVLNPKRFNWWENTNAEIPRIIIN